ncbi:hypothetical protein TorRG33x02_223380 [Trema orientale]|uniref:Uncharacterized protein n=1 Tax=Trema orientale TaxID=63057 RepID=A0A2P5E8E5_TREOI|nr:hypothetical protein TorRG33x02_223380 [Trema orientale]
MPFANSSHKFSNRIPAFLSLSSSLRTLEKEDFISESSRASFRCRLSERFLNFLSSSSSSRTD